MVHARRAPLARSTSMSARKSAAVSAGGINVRRLMLSREATSEFKSDSVDEDEEEDEINNECGNPFCRKLLVNRYASFCEDKPMCQRYRALKLQCLANAQACLDQEDTRPLSFLLKKKKKDRKEEFAIPRKIKAEGKKRLDSSEENIGHKETPLKKKREIQLEEKKKKKVKRTREGAESNGKEATATSRSPSVTSSVSSVEELASLTKKTKKKVHSRPETVETAKETSVSRAKKRRLSRRTSADDVLSRSAPSSPVRSAAAPTAPVADTNWKIPRAKPIRPRTAAQAIRRTTSVELVPLGVANPSNLTGGGRYVQNGNRSAAQSLRTSDPRARPPKLTKIVTPTPSPATAVPTTVPVSVPQPTVPPEQPHLRPQPPQGPSSTQPLPARMTKGKTAPPPASVRGIRPLPAWMTQQTNAHPPLGPAPGSHPPLSAGVGPPPRSSRSSPPLGSLVEQPTVQPRGSTSSGLATHSNGPAARPPEVHRISTSDYRKSRKSDTSRRHEGDYVASRSSSLERSTSFPGDRAPGFPPPASAYPPAPHGYRRNDSAPLPTYRDFRPPVDRRQYPGETRPYYDGDGDRIEYRDRTEDRSDGSAPAQWGPRNHPPHDYPPRQQEMPSFDMHDGGYDHQEDTRYNPAPPPVEQSYWREPSRGEPQAPPPPPPMEQSYWREPPRGEPQAPPPRTHVTSPHRGEVERVDGDRERPDHNDLEDPPLFSYHDEFLPRLLSVFIHKFPGSLEAVLNVTKKPRKMSWYLNYVERIKRFCQECDLQIKFEGLAVKVTVRGREWLTLRRASTITLYRDVIKGLREEAITWRVFHEEMQKAVAHYTGIYGSQADKSICFFRAWNELKKPGNYISLARQANYLCGARLHHWNFVIGKVEIGSGSHEDKREAFRLAAVSALEFLLSIGTGRRIRKKEVKPERAVDLGARRRRSSSHESTANDRDRAPGVNGQENGTDPPSAAVQTSTEASEIEEHPSSEQPSVDDSAEQPAFNLQSASSTEPLPSHITQTNLNEPAVSTTNGLNEPEVEQSDSGEEMSISDTSDVETPAPSPRTQSDPLTGVPLTVPESGKATASAAPDLVATSEVAEKAPKPASTESTETTPARKSSTADGDATASAVHLRRCMMCAMIDMRKPGERCLRCLKKTNGVTD